VSAGGGEDVLTLEERERLKLLEKVPTQKPHGSHSSFARKTNSLPSGAHARSAQLNERLHSLKQARTRKT
jgi:hypothetical protein